MATQPPNGTGPSIECCCTGNAHEMGISQGRALKTKITNLRAEIRHLDAFRLEQPWWMPYPLFLSVAEKKTAQTFIPALKQFDPGMLARLEGISAGSGVSLRGLCLLNAMEALLSTVRGRTIPAPPGACSAISVRGGCSREGEPIVAHNFDYMPLTQPFFVLRESRPRNGFRSLDFLVAAQAGTVDGMNEKGLCITLNYAFITDEGRPGPLITMAIADALANCSTASEAADRIVARPRWGGGLLMLADSSGDLLSVELSNTRSAVRRPPKGQDWLVTTNVCNETPTQAVQVPWGEVFSERVPQPLRGQPVLEWHSQRACRIEQLARDHGPFAQDELAALMADHGKTNVPNGCTPCVHTDYWRTTACLQWFPAKRRLRASFSTACAAKYVEFGL